MKDRKEYIRKIKEQLKEELKRRGVEDLSSMLENLRQRYVNEIFQFGIKDPEQSWKAFKGNLLEELILEILHDEIESLGFRVLKGRDIEKEETRLDICLANVKRSLVIDYGEFGMHLPDADIVIYDKQTCKPVAIISSKATLRERIAQVGYWYLKIKGSCVTRNIRVFFVTLDEDGDLLRRNPAKKGRAIAEIDTDGTFVITGQNIQESNKVLKFHKLIEKIKTLRQ